MFEKILIANRGEIACRIISTCKRMGISTVAVYSEADTEALHVKPADESCCIGESDPAESYLRIDKMLDAAKEHGSQAIHPGYGFLSENAEFARKCSQSGITFIGPSAEAIELMGEKDKAKAVMEKAGVPVVPGYIGAEQSTQTLCSEADKIGYPLMIKAVLGGGGKGMRVVQKKEDFEGALLSAQNEARKGFGDSRVMLEHFVREPRHIEFQVFGDQHGNIVHLFERDCSLQRRHQKIVEESPSLFLDEKLRTQMSEATISAAKAVKYTGAGTVEFIVGKDRSFYFMEMNTRLQVEHPVTEMITGLDLVEWQIRIAAGEKLPLTQAKIKRRGHAIEARIYAENPESGFLPSTGTVYRLAFPETRELNCQAVPETESPSSSKIRIDTGVEEGDQISIHYDPLIAKLIVHADSRKNAIQTMRYALSQTAVLGVDTNLGFLQSIMLDRDFEASQLDTLFVDSRLESLLEREDDSADWICSASAIYCFLEDSEQAQKNAQNSMEPGSPWHKLSSWRTGKPESYRVQLRNHTGEETEVSIACNKNAIQILNATEKISVSVTLEGNLLELNWNYKDEEEFGNHLLVLHHEKQLLAVHKHGRTFFSRLDPLSHEKKEEEGEYRLSAPMPGNIIRVLVKAGERVTRGQQLLVMEAMKMEHTIVAPADGIVDKVLFNVGDIVQNDAELINFSQLGINTESL